MKFKLVEEFRTSDALNVPKPTHPKLEQYNEWHHFNFNDHENQLYGICNLAISGNIHHRNRARVGVSLVVFDRNEGWHGTMNMRHLEEVDFLDGSLNLRIGESAVTFSKNRYRVRASLRDQSLSFNALFTPQTAAVRIDNIRGMISSFIVPKLTVEGTLSIAGHQITLADVTGYHDHNWGFWHWGKDLGWDWGYIHNHSPRRSKKPEVSIVYGRAKGAAKQDIHTDVVLIVWINRKVSLVFLEKAVQIEYIGQFNKTRIPRVPGVMAALHPLRATDVPEGIRIVAEDGDDRLSLRLDVETALQFLIPHPVWEGHTTITELVGLFTVEGQINGTNLNFTDRSFAEIAG
jgi:hypothetical protein